MLLLLRMGAYAFSGILLWQVFQGDTSSGAFAAGRHLVLDPGQGLVFGVCAGISNFSGLDVSLIRVFWAIAAFYKGIGIALYILAFLIMPMAS